MRSGAGAVILGTPESVYPILARKLTEVMVEPLAADSTGSLCLAAFDRIRENIAWCDRLVIGPGLSQSEETQELIRELVRSAQKPMLLDADGLNAVARKPSVLSGRRERRLIVTPHAGEFARLLGVSSKEVEADRPGLARIFARKYHATVVSKGAPTLTAVSSGEIYLNSTGNPGMATAGTGDVLAGVIAALWGQGMADGAAAYAGVYIHGLAGDLASAEYGEKGLVATDICELLPRAMKSVEVPG
jgi:NAD(P)H-hydrate epimerase